MLLEWLWCQGKSAYTFANNILIGHRDIQLTMEAISGPYYPISALHWHHCLNCDFMGLQSSLQENKPVNIWS